MILVTGSFSSQNSLSNVPQLLKIILCFMKYEISNVQRRAFRATYLSCSSFSLMSWEMLSQSFSSVLSVFWIVWFIVFSTSLHTSSIWFTQRLGWKRINLMYFCHKGVFFIFFNSISGCLPILEDQFKTSGISDLCAKWMTSRFLEMRHR